MYYFIGETGRGGWRSVVIIKEGAVERVLWLWCGVLRGEEGEGASSWRDFTDK